MYYINWKIVRLYTKMDSFCYFPRTSAFLILSISVLVYAEFSGNFRTDVENNNSGLTCAINKCNTGPEQHCLNGGICVFDQSTCESSCKCISGYSGSLCQTTHKLKVVTSEKDKSTVRADKKTRSEFDEPAETGINMATSSVATIMTTSDPRYNICKEDSLERTDNERSCSRTFKCKYGICEKTLEDNNGWTGWRYDCVCDIGAVGLMCENRCCLNCGAHGICAVHNGTEYCSCEHQYKGLKCDVFVPVPVKVEIREVTWYLWVVGVCATAFLVLIILSVVVPYYMWKHRVILIMKIVHYFQPYEDDDNKQWDAFVSYKADDIDEHFVVHSLYPKLEQELGFKLCLHFRDFVPGETISNNIINAVEGSRRTIIIISPRYIQSEFTRFEYQKAQQEMLKRKHKIIPVLLEDITSVKSGMDKTLKGIIDSVTYLEWPGTSCEKKVEKFWKRLTLSLPKKKDSSSFESNRVSSSSSMSGTSSSLTFTSPSLTFTSPSLTFTSSAINSVSVSSKVSNWLSSDTNVNSSSVTTENIYCEIKSVDEKLNKLNIFTIPTLSEKEEEDLIENYKRTHQYNTENTCMTDRVRSNAMQSQLSYNQSEVSSPTDSLTPLWIDKSEQEIEDKHIHRYLDILNNASEV